MTNKLSLRPAFLPAVLSFCLFIGAISNVVGSIGLAMIITVVLTFACTHLLAKPLNTIPYQRVRWLIGIGLIAMVIAQIYILNVMPDTVYHDPYRVLAQADQMAAGHMSWNITYFWRYANNVPLAYLMSLWLRLTQVVGMSTNVSIHLLSMLVLDSFIVLLLRTVWQLSKRNSLLLASFAFTMLTPFAYTYYLQVFYSDLPSMLVLLIVMRILLHWRDGSRRYHIVAGIGLVSATLLGEVIKANMIVMIPALMIIAGLLIHKHQLKKSRLLLPMLLIVLGFGLSTPTNQAIYRASNYTPNQTYQFPVTHWMLMGMNSKKFGMYAGKDVGKAIKLPDKAARQKADLKAIPRRAKHLGAFGLVRLWFIKIGIMLNVRDVGRWYNGGFQAAPQWYNRNASFYSRLTQISYSTATLVLFVTLMLRLLTWRPDLTDPRQVVALTGVVTALGYLAFHTLLWETEPRYGQAILPLLWFALAATPQPAPAPISQRERRFVPVLSPIVTAIPIIAAIALTMAASNSHMRNDVVAAQRSQLSEQYHAKPLAMLPQMTMSEKIDLNADANYLSVQVHPGSAVHVTLVKLATGEHYHLYSAGQVYRLHHQLPAGHYRIIVRNSTRQQQRVDVVHTYHYQLAKHPLLINGHANKTASFIYTCKMHN
ncbi:hypothetical protein [Lacticaseibacillus zhaodongensis]|uniref:hypothetical protein n=1 Tax=Lacticaseibacillus zhaodongensis TaxID=2668065 RepID=UPI0012D3371E|nr:hypothetical protein [Lacticaseibacillus zhaodongensis]